MGPRLDYKILVVEQNHIPTVCYLLVRPSIYLRSFVSLSIVYPCPLKDLEILQLLPYLDANNPGCESALDDLLRAYGECLSESFIR